KIVLTGDTVPTRSVLEIAHGADLLVHEATFCADEADRAHETGHSTAAEAADLALIHHSSRYFCPYVAREARSIFPETVVPRDLDIIDVRHRERGGPVLVKGGAVQRRPS